MAAAIIIAYLLAGVIVAQMKHQHSMNGSGSILLTVIAWPLELWRMLR